MEMPFRTFLLFFSIFYTVSGCPAGWYGFGDSCYLFRVRSLYLRGLNWDNARSYCLSFGGDLASMSNKSEMDFVYSKSSKARNEHYWIGLNDRQNESLFVWSDGTPYNRSVYSNWYRNEPNDRAGDEDCVELLRRRWNDDNCKKEYSYICERPKGAPMPTFNTVSPPPTSAPIACPPGWVFYGSSCYLFSDLRKKWVDAKTDCRASGGHLLKIDDASEQHFISITQTLDRRERWIGLSDVAVEGSYRWESDNSLLNYTHWATEEPNDHSGVEDCIAVYGRGAGGFWNDDYCDSEKYYICEKPGGGNLCPVNWRTFGDFCYKFNVHPALFRYWSDAERACMSYNRSTELISINNAKEQAYILRELRDLRVSKPVWLGLNDRKVEGRYEWSDKSPVTYKNWAPREPRSGFIVGFSDCSVIDTNTQNGTWSSSPCFFRRGYICKRKIGMGLCDSPFGMQDGNIGDNQITASSSLNLTCRASQARLRLKSNNITSGAWCAARNNVGEWLQIDLGVVRQVQHIALQGRPGSTDFVRRFYLRYGDNGLDFNSYGENATVKYKVLTGNNAAKTVQNIVLSEPINARFIRIYPLTWNNRICLRTEIYGCAAQASSKKCGVGWEVGLDDTCYQINSNQWKIWADARATCLSRGGDLVSILSFREKNWLKNRLKAVSGWAYSFWIGLNDRDMHKHFYWSDGSPYRLTAWDAGYPKDYTSQNLRACVEIDAAKGAWRDVNCGEYRPFICKRKMASTNGVKFPVTGNWISGTDYYWPLDEIVNGKALGTVPATIQGNVTKTDRLQNGRDTLTFKNFPAYLYVGQFQVQCITDPSFCGNGITVSFVVQFENGAKSWTENTFVVDTIGDETLLRGNRGFAVYVLSGSLYVTVVTRTKKWTVSLPLVTGRRAWLHVMFAWQLEKGLVLYINGTERASSRYGVSIVQSGSQSVTLTVGSKKAQPSGDGFFMRSLAVWRRSFSAQEVNTIYLAEFGSCRTGWKDFGQFCYQFNLNKKSWSDARVACVSQQAELVSIHSPVEQSHITLEVGPYGLQAEAWIGFHDQGFESQFEWSDRSPVVYTNWDGWNPDDWSRAEDCANVRSYNDGRWNDQNCRDSLAYICKRPKEYIAPGGIAPTSAPQMLYVCELTSAVLSCPFSTVLSVTTAYWGRDDANRCGSVRPTLPNCRLDVTSDIKKRCDGLNHCSLRASNSFSSDPCAGVSKYLEINYVCKNGRHVITSCPGGWILTPDGSRCLRLVFDRKSWQDARSACRRVGADLASIHSSMENIVLTSMLVNSWDIADVGGIWIGLTDAGQKGMYNWTDGSAVDYSSWLDGQPDERDLLGSCVSATLQPGKVSWLFWKDVDCARELPYVCARDPSNYRPPTSLPTTASNDSCPSGWMLNGSSCYKMMSQSKTWTAARDICRAVSQNSDLASIHSLAENTIVASLFNGSAFAAWIGLSDRGVLYGYVWSDKSPVEFTRWNPQQPDSHHGQQPCVEMYSSGEWGDTGCYSIKQFICKMPRSDNGPTTARPRTTTSAATPQAPDICPSGWILWNTMCYFFSDGSNSTWYEARQECQRVRGGDLVSILSVAENDFVKSKIQRNGYYETWIGLNDLGTEASFKWSDGSPVSYTNYGRNQPDDEYGQEDCLEIDRRGVWSDQHCSSTRPYICKKTNNTIIPAFTMVPPLPGPKLGRCNESWVNFDESCYLFVSESPQTWENARDVCRQGLNSSMKGDLVTVDDQYEQAFLSTMLFEKQADFWIGLNDRGREGWYWWTDNSPVKYTNWDANQPGHSNTLFDCIHMTYSRNHEGRWITAQCEQRLGYICERRALPLGPTTAASPSNGKCPQHYQLFGDDCYLVSYVKLSWQEAREVCRTESNGDLISVHTPLEQAFVVRSLKNFNSGLWLGFVREANSAAFSWTDHSLPMYSTWAAGEPNGLRTQKSCVVAKNSNAGLWSDEDCSQRNGFICRIRRGEPHVSPPVLGNCPAEWEKFDKNCYQFRRDRLSWTAARATCQRQGGNLVSITSRQEQDYIAYHYRHQYYDNIWTGLNDRALEAGYTWSDRSPVSFLNWLPGEPNDDSFIENCVEMSAGSFLWKDNICTKFNSYICKQPLECAGALGMVSGDIKSTQVTASSRVSSLYSPGMARLNSSRAWCAGNDTMDQFIQVDFLTETRLSKISTQGFNLNGVNSYVSLFKLQTSEDGVNFQTYRKNGKDWIFVANRDGNSVVTSAVEPSIDTRLIRLVPVSWKGSICMRLELYGCPFACETPLGMQSGVVKDNSVSASSSSDNQHRATNARPSSSVGWCAKVSDTRPWLQISFPNLYTKITKITTWGGGKGSGFVTVYRLMFTVVADVNTWADYKEGGKIRNFRGNQDAVNPTTHLLAEPIITRNLSLRPQSWSPGGACLRLELFGCEEDVQPTPLPSISPSRSGPPLKDVVYSGSVRLSKEEWTDEYKDAKSAAFKRLAAKVESSITEVYSGVDKASLAFLYVNVTGFRRGSVVVLFNLRFIGDIANELGANISSNLVNAVRTGSLGKLKVDPNSLSITKSDTGDQATAAARTGDESGGLSNGAKAGIAVTVVILVTIAGGAGAWWIYKKRKGKPLFNHQLFNNPVSFSSDNQEVKSDNGVISNKPTLKFQE